VLDRAVEHDGLAGKQPQVAEDVPQTAQVPVDGAACEDAALARLGGERRDAEIGRASCRERVSLTV
jgi:hypothetical protein